MDSYNHKKQLPIEISWRNFVKVYFQRITILISIVLINLLLLAIFYLFIFVFSGSKLSSLIVENLEIFYGGIAVMLFITLIIVIINFRRLTYYVQMKLIKRKFEREKQKILENSRKQQYKRVADFIEKKLQQNNTLSVKQKRNLENKLNQSVRQLDLKMMLELYYIVAPEESHDIIYFTNYQIN